MMHPLAVAACLLSLADAAASQLSAADLAGLQEAYVKASNTEPLDHFGHAVAVSGNTAVVSAPAEEGGVPGVDGDQSDNSTAFAGAAYVFVRDGGGWTQQAYLKASNPDDLDRFGEVVAISGDTIVIGAVYESSSGQGVDPDGGDDGMVHSGAAYVFVREGTTWSQQAFLKSSNSDFGDHFGHSVAVSGGTIVVGARFEDSSASGVNGDQDDNSLLGAGAAYVFVQHAGTWVQQAYLKASNPDFDDQFGSTVAISGDTIVVGATLEDSVATGVDGNQLNNSSANSGAAYVFTRSGTTWSQQAYLKASNTDVLDGFGTALSISGDTLAVSAPIESSGATGVDGNQADDSLVASGAVYVFLRSGTTWSQQAYVKASNPDAVDRFGSSVGVSGDILAVGASREDSRAKGIDGNQSDDTATDAGAAYVFLREDGLWAQQAYVKASNTGAGDEFGLTVSVDGDRLIVGAPYEDSTTVGINGPDNNNTSGSGAAYIYELGADPWSDLGYGLPGVAGVPLLAGTGPLLPASAGSLALTSAAPLVPAVLFVSLSSTPAPFKCGTLATVPVAFQLPLATSGDGSISLAWAAWPAGLSGLELHFQYAIADGSALCGVALSNALRASVP